MLSKRKKQRKAIRKRTRAPLTPAELRAKAQQALSEGHFRDAVSHFKDLLKAEPRAEWQEGLAAAYQGRARELAAKGMLKEALTIWRNRQQLCGSTSPDPDHVALLLRTGQVSEALHTYLQAAQVSDAKDLTELQAHFAVRYLAGPSELDTRLAEDDPIRAQGTAARDALATYCDGDDAALEQALAQIPFRSPYRDWAQILKALLKWPEDAPGAQRLLARITPHSPFAPLKNTAQLARLPEAEFLRALPDAGEAQQRFAAALRGWSEQRLTLWRGLAKPSVAAQPKALSAWMHRQREALGESWAHKRGLRLLIHDDRRSRYGGQQPSSSRPSAMEQDLIAAWHAEEAGDTDPRMIYHAWMNVARHLRQPSVPRPGSDNALRIALIQRRLAEKWNLLASPLTEKVEDQLEESLSFDPDDRPTYVRLMRHYRKHEQLKDARRLLDAALNRYPEDIEVLTEAVEVAVMGNAFKKATGFGRRILELDPINTRARESLLEAHLSHARKQVAKRRADLAGKELAAAVEWAKGEPAQARIDLLQGFLALDGAEPESGAATLRAAMERLGGGIAGRLELALEAIRLNRSPAALIKQLGMPKIRQPDKPDLLAFCRRVRDADETGGEIPSGAIEPFAAALKAGSKLELSRQESESVCEALRGCDLDRVRRDYAREALRRWPGLPVFELHAFEARYDGYYSHVRPADIERLEQALVRARDTGDMRTAHRLQELLEQVSFGPPPFFYEEGPEETGDPVAALIDEIGIEGVLDIFQGGPMSGEFKEAERQLGRKKMGEFLEALLGGLLPGALEGGPPERPEPKPAPGPRRVVRKKAERKAPGPARSKEPSDPQENDCDQLDLFK